MAPRATPQRDSSLRGDHAGRIARGRERVGEQLPFPAPAVGNAPTFPNAFLAQRAATLSGACSRKNACTFSKVGRSITPNSVTMPVMLAFGVTSKAGL